MKADLEAVLAMRERKSKWSCRVRLADSINLTGLDTIYRDIQDHLEYLKKKALCRPDGRSEQWNRFPSRESAGYRAVLDTGAEETSKNIFSKINTANFALRNCQKDF